MFHPCLRYATQLPLEDEFHRALQALNGGDESEVDESLIDEEALVMEVEAEEQAQQIRMQNQQLRASSSVFARIFNRDAPATYVGPFPH